MSPFAFKSYKKYLNHLLAHTALKKVDLANAADCHRPLVTQVLNGSQHFTPDQITAISEYLGLKDQEADYLYYLLAFERASSAKAKASYKAKLDKLSEEQVNLKERLDLKSSKEIELAPFDEYYTDIHLQLIHMATTLKGEMTISRLQELFSLSSNHLENLLEKLEAHEMVKRVRKKKGDVFTTGERSLHLPKESPLNFCNHRLMREKAISLAQTKPHGAINYSATYTMSAEDLETLKEMTISFISESRKIVSKSTDEDSMVLFNVDFSPI